MKNIFLPNKNHANWRDGNPLAVSDEEAKHWKDRIEELGGKAFAVTPQVPVPGHVIAIGDSWTVLSKDDDGTLLLQCDGVMQKAYSVEFDGLIGTVDGPVLRDGVVTWEMSDYDLVGCDHCEHMVPIYAGFEVDEKDDVICLLCSEKGVCR